MTVFQDLFFNKSFSQLAKESNFTFNLYRGRVDWKKLEELDVDRVVRDQDVELLNLHLNSITNCNLESEYDVKILDPNFIKLFRLAQLLIDFLLHSKKYLEHCIKVAHESLQTSNKEVEILRKQLQARKTEVKQLKKKFKEVKQQLLLSPGVVAPNFECSLCGKVFMNETFLHGHHSRRHQPLPYSLVLRPFNTAPASPQVKVIAQESEEKVTKVEEITNIKKKYQEEIEDLKKLFFAEIEKLKPKDHVQNPKTDIYTQYSKEEKEVSQNQPQQHQSKFDNILTTEIENSTKKSKPPDAENEDTTSKVTEDHRLVNLIENQSFQGQVEKKTDIKAGCGNGEERGGEKEWVNKLEQREAVWRARLSDLDTQHKKQVQQLQDKLNTTQQQGQEMKKELELRLEEALQKFEQAQKRLENKLQSVQENNGKQIFKDIREKEEKQNKPEMPLKDAPQRDSPSHPPPFQKRKAFVSQKSKTIQDSFEITDNKEPPENLVQVLNPDEDSDLEDVSTLTQNSSREKVDLHEMQTSILKIQNRSKEISSCSKNKESIIAKLLEEERSRNYANGMKENEDQEVSEEEETTLSRSVTETDSESGGEGGGRGRERRVSSMTEDQLLREESDLAQQSLQSMEALLAANPGILQQLRSDLAGLVGRRLQGLSIDPTWRGLPLATYRDKMAALQHQRNITAKSHPVYFTLRDKLRGDVESAVAVRSKAAPRSSAADNLLSKLRSKAAQVISAARFTRRLGSQKMQETLPKQNTSRLSDTKPLAASSPHLTSEPEEIFTSNQNRNSTVLTRVQFTAGESFSLSSSTEEEDDDNDKFEMDEKITRPVSVASLRRNEELELGSVASSKREEITRPVSVASLRNNEDIARPVSVASPSNNEEMTGGLSVVVSPRTQASVKSALRHTVSTSNLAKKKVLFVDEAFADSKRSQSENTIVERQNASSSLGASGNESVASLVQEIQQQLRNRTGKPAFSVDLMKQPDPAVNASDIPLSEILPLTKSGRDLLDSQLKNYPRIQSVKETAVPTELRSPRSLEPLSQILQRVPTSEPGATTPLGKKPDLLNWSSKSQLQVPKLSPDLSISSIGSSLLDLSASPRAPRRPPQGSLEWDLQDLEDNMKD